jgi:hypothetical protein
MVTLSRHDIRSLCPILDTYGEGTGPAADQKSFWYFSVQHVRRCLLDAMADSAKHEATMVAPRRGPQTNNPLSWPRAREIEQALYGHAQSGAKYMSDLRRGQDLPVVFRTEFSDVTRRLIAAYNVNCQKGGMNDDHTLASEVEPAGEEECVDFIGEMVDQKLEWIAEDLDDMPTGG